MKLLSVSEAAEQLGVSPALIYALCAHKRIRHERHGLGRGRIKIPENALEEYRQRVTVEVEAKGQRPLAPKTPDTFTNLDPQRLLEAWRRQGVVPGQPHGR